MTRMPHVNITLLETKSCATSRDLGASVPHSGLSARRGTCKRKQKLPVFGTLKQDWEEEQKEVLASAEEFDLLEQYKVALSVRDRQLKRERERASGSSPA